MTQRRITIVINKRFKRTAAAFCEMTGTFDEETIHEFRTDIKKLRAFLRLLNVDKGHETLKISKEIKLFYRYAGTIRDLQLQLKVIHEYPGNSPHTAIDAYLDYVKKIIEKWKGDLRELTGQKKDFHKDQKKIKNQSPCKLSKRAAKKFLQNKMDELACLLRELPDDDILHNIRKLLKDILYNWLFIKHYRRLLPPDLSDKEKIKSFTELIGLFLDKRTGIILLETYYKDCEEGGLFFGNETRELQEIEVTWKKKKEELAQLIYIKTGLLELVLVAHPVLNFTHTR